ncbi:MULTISPECIES: sugar phosphate isomerase/epimerase family protein [Mesorhizobium]|uniref:Sugar phosphate isomerase/epimerase n=1 Tax=Mesorhizobium denitrificans TaxID=2294114 RepID=A0A371XJX3_9HYPH|nr:MULTISPECIES: TIM barrel protein [Mesorhizobium]RFC69499.1 sugar phosphate isomerase/epimerase [Mesorhizobium denitrificans]
MSANPIPLGINLSFCVKRWVTADLWAPIVRDQLGLELVQFSYDLVDPMWPAALLDRHADAIRSQTDSHGITIHSAFIGLAHYTYSQLLHPDPDVRAYAEDWLGRAYAFAARAGITRVGGPLGAIASRIDGVEPDAIPEADYADLIDRMLRLAEHAKLEGLTELYVEPTPMRREWPWTVKQARRMANDVKGSAVPWSYCVDWGHGTFAPLYGSQAIDMEPWLTGLSDCITAIHIQQTDFQFDRHWDFTEKGKVDATDAAAIQRKAGLRHVPTFLEVFYPFERDDSSILQALRATTALLKRSYA